MTIRYFKRTLGVSAFIATAFGAQAGQAATATAVAKANILKQITVTKAADLNYATIITAPTAGSVQIAATAATAPSACTTVTCTGATTAAKFDVLGTVGAIATVSVPASVTLNSGANSMTSTLVSSAATLTLAATNSFFVGGTLSVGANQADGVYAGNFTVTVDYQ